MTHEDWYAIKHKNIWGKHEMNDCIDQLINSANLKK